MEQFCAQPMGSWEMPTEFQNDQKDHGPLGGCHRTTITCKQTGMRQPIPPAKRAAMSIWWLADVASYQEVSNRFGVGIINLCGDHHEVCHAMEMLLLQNTVYLGETITRGGGGAENDD